MKLGFEETQTPFKSATQNARVWTESWVHAWLYCPNCGAERVSKYPNNQPLADFFCEACREDFELKAQKGRFGAKVSDGAYEAKCKRLASDTNPNLLLMNYDPGQLSVTDLFIVPKHFFVRDIIQERPPLKETARRAGWIGSNILLSKVPETGKIFIIKDRALLPKSEVLAKWRNTLFLRDAKPDNRGWLIDVMKCVEAIGRREFTLDDVYAFEGRLQRLYPLNNNVRPKIRQQIQVLRDRGFLTFEGRGRYALRFES
ncbi:MAG TPA: DpnI domain-containing protein [Caulobacteraceae bacterium]|jgi:type II restriction enzyme|nr:DpnI domain-containing protein [Caulobacteraceae bacterium]